MSDGDGRGWLGSAEVCKESVAVGKAWQDFRWVADHGDVLVSVVCFQ